MSYQPNQQYPPPGQYPGYAPPQQPYGGGMPAMPSAPASYGSAPQGYGPPSGPPPPINYGSHPPPSYGAPPGPPQNYGPPPGPPGQNYGAPSGPPPPVQHYGAPSGPPPSHGGHQQQYQPPQYPQQQYQPPPQQQHGGYNQPPLVFLGVSIPPPPPHHPGQPPANFDPSHAVEKIRKATKGFGTDETALISALSTLDALQVNAVARAFESTAGKPLAQVLEKETSSYFSMGLQGIALGPVMWDVELIHRALSGPGTHEDLLTETLLGRSNDEILILKAAYRTKYHRTLEDAVRSDLSAKTERLFNMVLSANRTPDTFPVNQNQVNEDTVALYKAGEGKMGTDEITFCSIMTNRSNPHLTALGVEYHRKYKRTLTKAIKKEFSGRMKDALLYIAEGAKRDGRGVWRDAKMMEKAMAGLGTKDERLVWRIVRAHWNRPRMEAIKQAYQTKYKKSLSSRVRGETSGDYRKLMLALIGE